MITDFVAGDKIDLSGLDAVLGLAGDQASSLKTSANKSAGDLTFKVFDSINGAENALGFDIDGIDGPGALGPVTMVFGNVDGGAFDFAIALIGVSNVNMTDFML